MPAKIRRIAFILATAIALSSAPSAQALQAPDIRTVDLVPGEGSSAARGFTRLNGWDYFVTGGSNRFNATGIWRTNGATTELVAEDLTVKIEIGSFEIVHSLPWATISTSPPMMAQAEMRFGVQMAPAWPGLQISVFQRVTAR